MPAVTCVNVLLQEKIEQFDSEYLKKWLMNEPDPVDADLQDFYTKIVIKSVLLLQFCVAVKIFLSPPAHQTLGNNLRLGVGDTNF